MLQFTPKTKRYVCSGCYIIAHVIHEHVETKWKLWSGAGVGWGIFESQEFLFRYKIPRMNFFRPWYEYFLGLIGVHEFFFI